MAANTKKTTSTKKKTGGSAGAKSTKSAAAHAAPAKRPIRREICAVVCFLIGLFSLIGYFNVDAIFISIFCSFIKGLIGYGFYILPPALLVSAVILATHRGKPVRLRTACLLLCPLVLGALCHLLFCRLDISELKFGELIKTLYTTGKTVESGGAVSGAIAVGFKALFSVYGAVPVFFIILVAQIMAAFKVSPAKIAEKAREREHLEYLPEEDEELEEAPQRGAVRAGAKPAAGHRRHAIDIPMDEEEPGEYVEHKVGFFNTSPRVKTPAQVLEKHAANPTRDVAPLSVEEAAGIAGVTPAVINPADIMPEPIREIRTGEIKVEDVRSPEIKTAEISSAPTRPAVSHKSMDMEELASETDSVAKAVEEKDREQLEKPAYNYPPVELLHAGVAGGPDGREEMSLNRERLRVALNSFGVSAEICDVTRGPTVTRYDLELEAGVKLTKLTNLAGDLALSLGVSGVRIAPIPDKISTVGVEVPNKIVSTVYLRDIIASDNFKNAPSKLTFALGKDIGGNSICGNIAKLPHLLIAGTTGSGKSVCMNSLILSLLYKASPEEVRLIMVDPKMVELGIYNGIPHLYIPVVTDPKKAAGALQWSVIEMLKRYRLFSEQGVRDLAGYNAIQRRNGEQILPQVVIVIDELADLMLVASKEVEESICRVAQMGRAAGMHLVIATQRPSADVITGLMKANIPSRISFAVSSAMESRIILDQAGAEKLVGNGDMLYAPLGVGKPTRIQGAFVTDEEREEVVNFIKQYGEAEYSEEIMATIDKAAAEKSGAADAKAEPVSESGGSEFDELLPQAVDVIFETKQASVSMLQRRLKLGYSRAARIVDQMEEIGVVGPFEGSKPRQILITREQWQEMQTVQGTAPVERISEQMNFSDLPDDSDDLWGE